MNINLIKNESDYQKALKELEKVFDAEPDTPEGDKAQMLVLLIEKYEEKNYPIEPPDPIEAIKYIMEERGLEKKDLIPYFGSINIVAKVLKREKNMTLRMIKLLHDGLGLPYEALIV